MKLIHRFIVVLLLLFSRSLSAQDVINGCGMEGKVNVTSPTRRQSLEDLNRLKNRWHSPTQSDINPNITLTALLKKTNDMTRWKTSDAAVIEGYVYNVKVGGIETCNCGTHDKRFKDTHIELTLSALPSQTVATRRVVVEVTPRLRKQMDDQNIDWTTDGLKSGILHHRIRVTGWMFFDGEHDDEAENTNPNGEYNWRATAWEIHPITDIEVLDSPP